MTIHVEDLKFKCIIGILNFERLKEQEVVINLTINYDYKKEFINYVDVVEFIKTSMVEQKFLLIEDALSFLDSGLKQKFPLISSLSLKITKPTILTECMVSVSI